MEPGCRGSSPASRRDGGGGRGRGLRAGPAAQQPVGVRGRGRAESRGASQTAASRRRRFVTRPPTLSVPGFPFPASDRGGPEDLRDTFQLRILSSRARLSVADFKDLTLGGFFSICANPTPPLATPKEGEPKRSFLALSFRFTLTCLSLLYTPLEQAPVCLCCFVFSTHSRLQTVTEYNMQKLND